jgi:hypothetical protein
MTLIATKPLYNPRVYGRVSIGTPFTVDDRLAQELIMKGYAVAQTYDTKILTPATPLKYDVKEGTAAKPFRDVPAADQEPPALAAVRVAVRAVSDASAPGNPGSVERRKRGRPPKAR